MPCGQELRRSNALRRPWSSARAVSIGPRSLTVERLDHGYAFLHSAPDRQKQRRVHITPVAVASVNSWPGLASGQPPIEGTAKSAFRAFRTAVQTLRAWTLTPLWPKQLSGLYADHAQNRPISCRLFEGTAWEHAMVNAVYCVTQDPGQSAYPNQLDSKHDNPLINQEIFVCYPQKSLNTRTE